MQDVFADGVYFVPFASVNSTRFILSQSSLMQSNMHFKAQILPIQKYNYLII